MVVANSNLTMIQGVNYYSWRLIEAIVEDSIDIAEVQDLEKLLYITLPNGDTFLHALTDRNSKNLPKLLDLT